jgi:hypothetical protein
MAIWNDIVSNYETFMESGISGSTHNEFREIHDLLDLKIAPTSLFNGSYVVQYNGIGAANIDVNAVESEFQYNVRLQIGFELNAHDNRTSYTQAVEDIETIVRMRLSTDSYDSVLGRVELQQASPLVFNINSDNGVFGVANLDFRVFCIE